MLQLREKTSKIRVDGLWESVPATAIVRGFLQDGSAEYAGDSEVHWDGQEQITTAGYREFALENGEIVPETMLEWYDDGEDPVCDPALAPPLKPPPGPLEPFAMNDVQREILQVYADGDYKHVVYRHEAEDDLGREDTLLLFLIRETADLSEPKDVYEAQSRVATAIRDLEQVLEHLTARGRVMARERKRS